MAAAKQQNNDLNVAYYSRDANKPGFEPRPLIAAGGKTWRSCCVCEADKGAAECRFAKAGQSRDI